MSFRQALWALFAGITFACAAVVSTYSVFDHTWDEPEHLAAGMAFIDRGQYPYDLQHPPLARIAMAIGPYLAGARSHGGAGPSGEQEGRDILYGPHYELYLTLARVGMLPFLLILVTAAWLWARHSYGNEAAALAALLVATTPVLIGHAGVAALDVPMVGTTLLALYALLRWFDAPGVSRAVLVGLSGGIAAGTKLSAIPFIGVTACVWGSAAIAQWFARSSAECPAIAVAQLGRLALQIFCAAIAAALVLWATYGFDAALAVTSFQTLLEHNATGHLSYFMGEIKSSGWWDFYSVALAVKTPLALLLTGAIGMGWSLRSAWSTRDWRPAASTLAFAVILVFASAYSHINIGVRHVLILFPLLAIAAAGFLAAAWQRFPRTLPRSAIAAVLLWQGGQMIAAHPDYLADFNLLAGSHPERILVDSDLDWGQDLKRLETELQQRNIRGCHLVYRGTADFNREAINGCTLLWPNQRAKGWIAVSLLAKYTDESGGYRWLDAYTPIKRIGKSIDLYYIDTQ